MSDGTDQAVKACQTFTVAAGSNAVTVAVDPTAAVVQALAAAGVELGEHDDVLSSAAVTIHVLLHRIADLSDIVATITAERDDLQAKLAAADGAPKAKAAKAPKVRKVAAVEGDPLTALELLELVRGAGKVEVAFSDGKRELAAIPARVISGDAWAVTVAGLALRGIDIELTGMGGMVEIVGYGLLLDGEQVAYRQRMDPLQIASGAKVSLAGDIVF